MTTVIPLPKEPLTFTLKGSFGDSTDDVTAHLSFVRWSGSGSWEAFTESARVVFDGEQQNGSEIMGDGRVLVDPANFQQVGKYALMNAVVFGIRSKLPVTLLSGGQPEVEFLIGEAHELNMISGYTFAVAPLQVALNLTLSLA